MDLRAAPVPLATATLLPSSEELELDDEELEELEDEEELSESELEEESSLAAAAGAGVTTGPAGVWTTAVPVPEATVA